MILALPLGHMIEQCAILCDIYIIHLMCSRKTVSDNNIYFRATPHICTEMYEEEEEQVKTPIFTMENEGVARK